jgi:hypothetical protein
MTYTFQNGTLYLNIEKGLEGVIKWLRKSGLKVNDDKTDICMVSRHDIVKVNTAVLLSSTSINMLGVLFDKTQMGTPH